MPDNHVIILVSQGLPSDLHPGETVPNLSVQTRTGTMALYAHATDTEGVYRLYFTSGPSLGTVLVCAAVGLLPDGGELYQEMDLKELGASIHGLYTAFFAEQYMDEPKLTASLLKGREYQTVDDAVEARRLVLEGVRQHLDIFHLDVDEAAQAFAENAYEAFDSEDVEVGDLSAFEAWARGDDDLPSA